MKKYLLAISVIIICCFSQCEPEPTHFEVEDDFPLNWNDYPRAYMDEEMVSYFAVGGEGSRFIYQNTDDQTFDTVEIVSVHNGLDFESDSEIVFEAYRYKYRGKQLGEYRQATTMRLQEDGEWQYETRFERTAKDVAPLRKYNDEFSSFYGHEFIDTIQVGDKIYYDVIKINQNDYQPQTYLLYAKGIGLIQHFYSNSYSFDLIKYELK